MDGLTDVRHAIFKPQPPNPSVGYVMAGDKNSNEIFSEVVYFNLTK